MKKAKILATTIFNYPHVGGASTHLTTLRKKIYEMSGIDFYIISWNSPNKINAFYKKISMGIQKRIFGIETIKIVKQGIDFIAEKIKKKISEIHIDIINPQSIYSFNSCLLIKELAGIPKVLTVHGYATYEAESAGVIKGENERKFYLELERNAYEKADLILTVDSSLKDYILSFNTNFKNKVVVWPNSVDDIFFKNNNNYDKTRLRETLGIPIYAIVVLCPRRLVAKNGVMIALKSFINLKDYYNIYLIFAGSGPLEGIIRREIPYELRQRVLLLGDVDHKNMPKIFALSDLVIIPSVPDKGVIEATSISALEAAASKVPIIASNIGGLREIFKNYEHAILVDPGKPELISNAILDLIKNRDLYESLKENAFKLVSERYNSNKWISDYLTYIRTLFL